MKFKVKYNDLGRCLICCKNHYFNMQNKLPLKFIRTNSQNESIEWIYFLLDKYIDK